MVNQYGGDNDENFSAIQQLNELDYRIPSFGETVADSRRQVEKLLADAGAAADI